jgi:hypothetical protein
MRKFASVLVVLALAVMMAPAVSAQAPSQDSVVGSGTMDRGKSFEIDVRSGPSGENVSGTATVDSVVGVLSGSASCLSVRDHEAIFNVPGTLLGLVTFRVIDNAELGIPFPDVVAFFPSPFRSPSDCSPLFISGDLVETGDIAVVDAPPFPTSKAQCKNGGWRNFPGFKNQGDCVSFVATNGKNPPERTG